MREKNNDEKNKEDQSVHFWSNVSGKHQCATFSDSPGIMSQLLNYIHKQNSIETLFLILQLKVIFELSVPQQGFQKVPFGSTFLASS